MAKEKLNTIPPGYPYDNELQNIVEEGSTDPHSDVIRQIAEEVLARQKAESNKAALGHGPSHTIYSYAEVFVLAKAKALRVDGLRQQLSALGYDTNGMNVRQMEEEIRAIKSSPYPNATF